MSSPSRSSCVEAPPRVLVCSLPARLTPSNEPPSHVRTLALSKRALYVSTAAPMQPGTRVQVDLVAGHRPVRFAEGTVTFTLPREPGGEHGVLVTFDVLPTRSQALIHHLHALAQARRNRATSAVRPPNPYATRSAAVEPPPRASALECLKAVSTSLRRWLRSAPVSV